MFLRFKKHFPCILHASKIKRFNSFYTCLLKTDISIMFENTFFSSKLLQRVVICIVYSTVIEKSSSLVQIGKTNTTKIKIDPKRQTDTPFFVEQYGDANYFIIQLDDRRQSRHLELQSSEDG